MKWSKLLIPTVKEVPADAETPSHQLMIRAGLIRKLASGTYTYLPLGWRSLLKAVQVVRQEMNAHDAQEISMPILQPMDLWAKTGRDVVFEDIMCKFTDRHNRQNALAPTAEEVVTSLAAAEISSYKQLPVNLYQINTKFRDEFRPRYGVIRSREFLMKDAYSFHASEQCLDQTYQQMARAYCRIFQRCGINYLIVEAESGGMGGSGSQEFMVACSAGEDILLISDKGNYSANVEKAETGQRPHDLSGDPTGDMQTVQTPDCQTIDDVCGFFKKQLKTTLKPKNMLKTLVCQITESDNDQLHWIIAVVRGDHELNEAKLRAAALHNLPGVREVTFADEQQAKQEGFKIGFVGPHLAGQDFKHADKLAIIVDPDAAGGGFWVTGANQTDNHVKHFNWKRDVIDPLGDRADHRLIVADIRNARQDDPSPLDDGGILQEKRGIEVGHVFKLGTKYSRTLNATFLDENGQDHPCIMGCYGIGVNRILVAAIENDYDKDGIIWPISIAPFEVLITPANQNDPDVVAASEKIYQQLRQKNMDVLLDDRQLRGGVKFKDADLIGIPLRITIGQKSLAQGNLEIKLRRDTDTQTVSLDQAAELAAKLVTQLYDELKPE